MTECQIKLREAGKPYPRTCAKCKLGKCQDGQDYASLTARIRELEAQLATPVPQDSAWQPETVAVRVKPLVWAEHMPPNEECRYDHMFADSVFGRYSIEWKSWKEQDDYGVFSDGDFIDSVFGGIDDAKAAAQADYAARILSAVEAAPAAAVRDAALEEAAKSCDAIAGNTADFGAERRRSAGQCAAAIRAMKGGAK